MSDLQITSQTIQRVKIGVHVSGAGAPIILLHGWGASLQSMEPIIAPLVQQGFQIHALDLPGFGTAEMPPEAWDVPRYAELVLAYLDSAKLDQVRLIGHSFGGRISIYLGGEHPTRIKQIVLVDSAGVRPEVTPKQQVYRLGRNVALGVLSLPGLKTFQPAVRKSLSQQFGSQDYLEAKAQSEILAETFKLVVNQDLVPFARRIKAPTLLIWGELDQDTPLRDAKILEAAIPDAGLVVFNGAGHYSYLDRPAQFIKIVTNFFQNG